MWPLVTILLSLFTRSKFVKKKTINHFKTHVIDYCRISRRHYVFTVGYSSLLMKRILGDIISSRMQTEINEEKKTGNITGKGFKKNSSY